MTEKATANDLTVSNESEKQTVETPFGDLSVWIKPLSWIERQNALTRFVTVGSDEKGNMAPNIDFGGYWEFVLTTCITKTDPEMSKEELLNIRPEVGEALQALLPSFESLMTGLAGGMTGPLA